MAISYFFLENAFTSVDMRSIREKYSPLSLAEGSDRTSGLRQHRF